MTLCEELYFEIYLSGEKFELKRMINYLKSGELDDDDLDAVSGGACARTEQARDAQDAVSSMPCPRCGAVGDWAVLHKLKDCTDFYCANCKVIVWTKAEENNSILHTNNNFYYPMTP